MVMINTKNFKGKYFNLLQYNKPIKIEEGTFKANLNFSKEKKFMFETPNMKLLNTPSISKNSQEYKLALQFSIHDEDFYHFMRGIDDYNIEYINKKSEDWFKSNFSKQTISEFYTSCIANLIDNDIEIPYINMEVSKNCNIYQGKYKIPFNKLKKNMDISLVVELKGLKFLKKKLITNWSVLQVNIVDKVNLTNFLNKNSYHKDQVIDDEIVNELANVVNSHYKKNVNNKELSITEKKINKKKQNNKQNTNISISSINYSGKNSNSNDDNNKEVEVETDKGSNVEDFFTNKDIILEDKYYNNTETNSNDLNNNDDFNVNKNRNSDMNDEELNDEMEHINNPIEDEDYDENDDNDDEDDDNDDDDNDDNDNDDNDDNDNDDNDNDDNDNDDNDDNDNDDNDNDNDNNDNDNDDNDIDIDYDNDNDNNNMDDNNVYIDKDEDIEKNNNKEIKMCNGELEMKNLLENLKLEENNSYENDLNIENVDKDKIDEIKIKKEELESIISEASNANKIAEKLNKQAKLRAKELENLSKNLSFY